MALARGQDTENERIVLGLLESVERDGTQSQRKLAADLGIALGLVNAYLKRCMKKGLLKVSQVPTRRYAYYLTPKGFSEKSRLTVEYLAVSLSFFRRARAECAVLLAGAHQRGVRRIALLGVSDLAEIATLCALESGMTIVAVVDEHSPVARFVGVPVVASIADAGAVDAAVVTDLQTAQQTLDAALAAFGPQRVLVPAVLGVKLPMERAANA